MHKHMYASIPCEFDVTGEGKGFVVERVNHQGMFMVGGPIERKGRLRYINGATDSLIISPPRKGDPCLNVLFFPPRTVQTPHTHPSPRVGLVVEGRGRCVTPYGTFDLSPEMIFMVREGTNGPEGIHSFETDDSPLVVIVFHPDTDFGPEDENHPMINRTIVEGVSAASIKEIQTKTL